MLNKQELLAKADAVETEIKTHPDNFYKVGHGAAHARSLMTCETNIFTTTVADLGESTPASYNVLPNTKCLVINTWFSQPTEFGVPIMQRYSLIWDNNGSWYTSFTLDELGNKVKDRISEIDFLTCAQYEAVALLHYELASLSENNLDLTKVLQAIKRLRVFFDENIDNSNVLIARMLCNQLPDADMVDVLKAVL